MGRVMYERFKNINLNKIKRSYKRVSQGKHFSALRASVWSKNKEAEREPRAPPLDPPLRCLLLIDSELQLSKFGQTQEEKFSIFCFLFFVLFLSLIWYVRSFISTGAKVLTKTPSIMKLFLRKHGYVRVVEQEFHSNFLVILTVVVRLFVTFLCWSLACWMIRF